MCVCVSFSVLRFFFVLILPLVCPSIACFVHSLFTLFRVDMCVFYFIYSFSFNDRQFQRRAQFVHSTLLHRSHCDSFKCYTQRLHRRSADCEDSLLFSFLFFFNLKLVKMHFRCRRCASVCVENIYFLLLSCRGSNFFIGWHHPENRF